MGSIHYDHAKRKAWETHTGPDPDNPGRLCRLLGKEIPYEGEAPFSTAPGKTPTPQEKLKADADKLRREIVGFLAHGDDSPLEAKEREKLVSQLRWHEEHK